MHQSMSSVACPAQLPLPNNLQRVVWLHNTSAHTLLSHFLQMRLCAIYLAGALPGPWVVATSRISPLEGSMPEDPPPSVLALEPADRLELGRG